MRKIIVNSTPLIALAKANKLETLKGMYEHIIIPEAVYREVTEKDDVAAQRIEAAREWIEVRKLIKMFNLVNIGERAGSGIPNIYSVWKKQGWKLPVLSESYDPDRITLSLAIEKTSDKKVGIKSNDKKVGIKSNDKRIASGQKRAIIGYLTDHIQATSSELSILLGVGQERTRKILRELVAEEIIVTEGANRNRVYKLKA